MFADTNESETVFAPVIQAGAEAFKVSQLGATVNMQWDELPGIICGFFEFKYGSMCLKNIIGSARSSLICHILFVIS